MAGNLWVDSRGSATHAVRDPEGKAPVIELKTDSLLFTIPPAFAGLLLLSSESGDYYPLRTIQTTGNSEISGRDLTDQ